MKMNTLLTLGDGINAWMYKLWFRPANSDLALNPDGSIRYEGVDWLFMFILWVSIISFLMLMVPMTWWSFKYRRRAGVPAIRTPNHNTPLEVTWVVVPLIVVTFIFFWGFHGYMRAQVAPGNAVELIVSAQKWNWSATYPNGAQTPETVYFDYRKFQDKDGAEKVARGNFAFPVFVVPAGLPVKVRLSSKDVLHAFYVADFRNKIDVYPNRYTTLTFTPLFSTPGEFSQVGTLLEEPDPKDPTKFKNLSANVTHRDHYLFCAEYCGDLHSEMAGIIRVVSQDDFRTIVHEWGNIEPTTPPVEVGQIYYNTKGCATCHSIDGTIKQAPSWKGRYGTAIEFTNGTKLEATPDAWDNYIHESMLDPQARTAKGFEDRSPMPSQKGQISERGINAIIAYIRSLNGASRPEDSVVPPADSAPGAAPPAAQEPPQPPSNQQ